MINTNIQLLDSIDKNKKKAIKEYNRKENKQVYANKKGSEWYNLRPILGNSWAMFFFLLGAREAGKSYSVTSFFVDQFVNKNIPFYWLRLTEFQTRKLLQNNAEKLIDPDIRRKYKLDLSVSGSNVYLVTKRSEPTEENPQGRVLERKLMARVLALSTFYSDKGNGLFDKDFLKDKNMRYNIAVDEFQREKSEKNTFDVLYALTNQLENLVRSTKERVRIFFIGNTLEEASDVLCAFDFIPEKFGIYKLKRKRCVIEYIEPSEKYITRRKGTVADILMPEASTFTNVIDTDKALISKEKLLKPKLIIKFDKDKSHWFVLWNNNLIAPYNNEKIKNVIAMRPYIDEIFNSEQMKNVIALFDTRCFLFRNLITFKKFQSQLLLLKPRGSK